jgi:hypothetical protein
MKPVLVNTLLFTALLLATIPKVAQGSESVLVPDPNFPLIQLPATFDSHRSTKRVNLAKGQDYKLIDVKGPGCVRHFWITTTAPDELELEITCDGAVQAQVKTKMHRFFGVLLGKEPYRIESAPIQLLPRNGYNSYFPIPFQSSCQIVLRNTAQKGAAMWSMVDWQKYDSNVKLTPYRLHALFSEEKPAEPLGTTLLGSIGGKGFVAGMFHAILRHDMRDVIWHTGGDTWLIDGETNPHVIRGIGSEDVFGYSFGVYKDLSQWVGGVHAVGENKNTSEIVAYRFFGPDSIAFKSSMVLRFGTRANDIESVLYYYKDLDTKVPIVESPKTWTLAGPFGVSNDKSFGQEKLPENVEKGTSGQWDWGLRKLSTIKMESEHTWVDFTRWFRRNQGGNVGTQPDKCAAYASTVVTSPEERKVTLCLGFDDWMKIWLNGQPIAVLQHNNGFKLSEVPVTLKKGDNRLVVRLSNFNNIEWRCWAFSCVIGNAEQEAAADTDKPRR